MQKMRLFVIAEHMRSYYAFYFRIKMGEEIGVAKQHPIEEKDIIDFHAVKYHKKSCKEFQERETVSYTVPYGKDCCPRKQ